MATDPGAQKRSFWGRVVVLGLFWTVAGWVALAIIGSVVTTLYGHPPAFAGSDALARTQQREWCLRMLAGLRDELESEVTNELTRSFRGGQPLSRFAAFNERWLADFELAADRCTAEEHEAAMSDAYAALRTLQEGYAASVEQFIRTRSDIGGVLSGTLKALTSDAGGPAHSTTITGRRP